MDRDEIFRVLAAVATPAALYRLKKDTVRAKDREDAEAIRQHFGLELES